MAWSFTPRLVSLGMLLLLAGSARADSYRTRNFLVTAPSLVLAREVAHCAEHQRHRLAVDWLGGELSPWPQPCPISVEIDSPSVASGETSYRWENGSPVDWRMRVRGSPDAIRESILPHEVAHTVFATYFGRPLPRWAEEGACVTVEHVSEQQKLERLLRVQYARGKVRSVSEIVDLLEYPQDFLPIYAQGYSLVRFLIARGGKQRFVQFLDDGLRHDDWQAAAASHYGYRTLAQLQAEWLRFAFQ